MIRLSSVFLAVLIAPVPPPENPPRRIDLGEGTLVLPDGYRPRGGRADIIFHMHGAVPVVEKALAESGWGGPLLLFNRKGLSSAYTEPFRDPALLTRLLEKSRVAIGSASPGDDPKIGRVFISSFSAGFGGVRELLAVPEHFARIDGLILADSLYAGYLGNPAQRQIDPAKMAGFRKFAASALAADEDWGDGWRLKRRFAKGRFLVLGFAGDGPEDHMRHLRRLGAIWRAAR